MNQAVTDRLSIGLCIKIAAVLVMLAGIVRLAVILAIRYEGLPAGNWMMVLPVPVLLGLSIGVYYKNRLAWGLSLLLCTLLTYQIISPWITVNWSQFRFTTRAIPWLIVTALALLNYVLAIVFLFMIQVKKSRQETEESKEKLSESI